MSDMLRVTGMYSGIDTDSTVKKLIQSDQIRVDKAKQDKQIIEWQKEDYREVASLLRGFEGKFFDVLNSETNLKSENTFKIFSGSATVAGEASEAVKITATSDSIKGSFTIDSVTRLATKDVYESTEPVIGHLQSTEMDDIGDIDSIISSLTADLTFTLDGVTKTIELKDTHVDFADLAADLTIKLQEEFANVDIEVSVNGDNSNQLYFSIKESGESNEEAGHVLSIDSEDTQLLSYIGMKEDQSNSVDIAKTLADVFDTSGESTFKINDVSFTFAEDEKIEDVISSINSSSAGVTIGYDSFADQFKLESNLFGTNNIIDIEDTDGLLEKFKLQGANTTYTAAQSAIFEVNGVETTRDSNSFEVYGTNIVLQDIPASAITVDIEADTADTKELIVNFVESYNTLIQSLNDKTSEKKYYDFNPLTDSERSELSDDEIENWESKARSGILRSDRRLESITNNLRTSLYESIDSLGINLFDIGITTSNDYQARGKLTIDESKLNTALEERPNEIIELFTRESDVTYNEFSERSTRRSENGLAQRIADIIKDSIRITGDSNGTKGHLIELAGNEIGTDTSSVLALRLTEMDNRINSLLTLLGDREEKYYAQFARMETALSKLSSQSDMLTQQFGG